MEDFEATPQRQIEDEENDDSMQRALMESKVRRNLDKPCRTITSSQNPKDLNDASKIVSDRMKHHSPDNGGDFGGQ